MVQERWYLEFAKNVLCLHVIQDNKKYCASPQRQPNSKVLLTQAKPQYTSTLFIRGLGLLSVLWGTWYALPCTLLVSFRVPHTNHQSKGKSAISPETHPSLLTSFLFRGMSLRCLTCLVYWTSGSPSTGSRAQNTQAPLCPSHSTDLVTKIWGTFQLN